MEIGKLNKRITYTPNGAAVINSYGGYSRTAGTAVTTWCGAKKLSQRESLSNGLQLGQSAYEFTFRYEQGDNISQTTSLTFDSRSFRVINVIDIDENYRVVKVLANERTD